jgi:acyl-CoA synthetase (NDP forming)
MDDASHPLHPLFHPRSVAVIGASADPHKIGGRTFRYLKTHGFPGEVYPINSRASEIQGVPAVATVAELPGPVDLGIVIVPAAGVPDTVEACAERGLRSLVIFSSGFAEMDAEGGKAQERIGAIARASGMRIVGPNCIGIMNVLTGMWATFTGSFDYLPPIEGSVGLISQSGAFGVYGSLCVRARGMGLRLWATTGNEVDVDVADCLAYFAQDEGTNVLMAYMEGCKDRDRLVHALELARAAHKPIVMLKVGRSEVGARAAASHTASLVGSDAVYDAIFRQYGVHRVHTIESLVDVTYAAAQGRLPAGERVALVTVSGGVGVIMADAAEEAGLPVPEMPAPVQAKLKALIPYAAVRNPVDTTAQFLNDLSLVQANLEIILAEGGYDALVIFLSSVGVNSRQMAELRPPLAELRRRYPVPPIILSGTFSPEQVPPLEEAGFLVLEDPNRAVAAIAALVRFARTFGAEGGAAPPSPLPAGLPPLPRHALSEVESKGLLAAAGLPVVAERLTASAEEAAAAAAALGFPVALKIVSKDIPHKSEMGGVLLGLGDAAAVRKGFAGLMARTRAAAPKARIEGVLVSPFITDGVETILGVQRDPVFGPVVMFGLGGIFVEVLQDVTLRIAPFGEDEAHAMIREVKGFPLLRGARGRPPADIDALARALSLLSAFAAAYADTLETLDINPFLVRPEGQGAVAVDALIVPRAAAGKG